MPARFMPFDHTYSSAQLRRRAGMLGQLLSCFRSDLAVDLGTANTLISLPREGVVLNEPSVVAVEEGTRRVLSRGCAVGRLAKQIEGRTPHSMAVVRPVCAGVVADFALCEAMLRYFLKKVRPNRWQAGPRAMFAIPGSITPVEKRALFNSAQRAGIRQVYAVPEAKAAAVGAGLPIHEPVASMICDIGGGTTEVAVLSLGNIVAAQSVRTAGEAMDRALCDYFRRQYSLRITPSAAEQLKIDIGSAYPLAEELVEEVRGVDTVSRLPRKATVTSEEVRHALAEPLEEIVEAIHLTLDGCSPDLAADLVDQGLVVCGGGALVRGLDRFLQERTGLPTRIDSDPLTTVARGNAICLENWEAWQRQLESSEDDV